MVTAPKVFPPVPNVTSALWVRAPVPISTAGELETVRLVVVAMLNIVPVKPVHTIFPPPAVSCTARILELDDENMPVVIVFPFRSRVPLVNVNVPVQVAADAIFTVPLTKVIPILFDVGTRLYVAVFAVIVATVMSIVEHWITEEPRVKVGVPVAKSLSPVQVTALLPVASVPVAVT